MKAEKTSLQYNTANRVPIDKLRRMRSWTRSVFFGFGLVSLVLVLVVFSGDFDKAPVELKKLMKGVSSSIAAHIAGLSKMAREQHGATIEDGSLQRTGSTNGLALAALAKRLRELAADADGTDEAYNVHFELGELYMSRGNYAAAAGHFETASKHAAVAGKKAKAEEKTDGTKKDSEQGNLRFWVTETRLGIALLRWGSLPNALGHLRRAEKALVNGGASWLPQATMAQLQLGSTLREQGAFSEALALQELALKNAASVSEAEGAVIRSELAKTLDDLGRHEQAMSLHKQAVGFYSASLLKTREGANLRPEAALAGQRLGTCLQWQGRLDEAVLQYKQSIRLLDTSLVRTQGTRSGDLDEHIRAHPVRGLLLMMLAQAHGEMDSLEVALSEIYKAMEMLEAHGPEDVPQQLGNVYVIAGELLWKIATHEASQQSKSDIAVTRSEASTSEEAKPKLREAEHLVKKGVKMLSESLGVANKQVGEALNVYGGVLHEQGDIQGAKEAYLDGLRIADCRHPKSECAPKDAQQVALAVSYNNLATLYDELRDSKRAEEMYRKAWEVQSELWRQDKDGPGAAVNLGLVVTNLGELLETEGEPEEALKVYEQVLAQLRGSNVPEANPTIMNLKAKELEARKVCEAVKGKTAAHTAADGKVILPETVSLLRTVGSTDKDTNIVIRS